MDTLSSAVEWITFYNPKNGYTVLRLRVSGVALLITNHEPDIVPAIADDVLLMESDIPPQFGTLGQIFTAEALSRIYQLPIRLM